MAPVKLRSAQLFLKFLRFGCLAWGGPVAQIAMIKKELVEEEKWITPEQFNRVLAVYQALPGPEAHELCVYFGMKAGGRWGGFLAGLAFMLPGFTLMLMATWLYIHYGLSSPGVQQVFAGIQAAVIALLFFAVYRIGKHSILNPKLLLIAVFSAIGSYLGINFLLLLLAAGLSYSFWNKRNRIALIIVILLTSIVIATVYQKGFNPKELNAGQTSARGYQSGSSAQIVLTGLKGGLLSFGGAYTAIPIIREDAVSRHHWMTEQQFLDGIAISGILPAPLIIFSAFAGYFGGGWSGAIFITLAVFLPAFSFTLVGHNYMEKLIARKSLHDFLDGITAGVIGLIGFTALQLFSFTVNTLFGIILFAAAVLTLVLFRSRYTVIFVITGAGLLSLIWNYLSGI